MSSGKITTEVISEVLVLNDRAKTELQSVDHWAFNIFTLRDATQGGEMTALVSHIFA